jgi:hypothetical protein
MRLRDNFFVSCLRKRVFTFPFLEGGASEDELVGTPTCDFLSARDGSNAAANAHFHSKVFARSGAQFANKFIVLTFTDGGIEIDDVQPGIFLEFLKQTEDIGDSQFAFASVHQLDRLTAL